MKRLICFFIGHWRGPWFATVQGACSQTPSMDGVKCYRCGRLLGCFDKDDNLVPMNLPAPQAVDLWDYP